VARLREGGVLISFSMPAVGNAYTKSSGIRKKNICVVYLSVGLSINQALVGKYIKINSGEGKMKRGIFFRTELMPAGMIVMINSAR